MQFCGSHRAEQHGATCQNATVHGKLSTAVSANDAMRAHCRLFSMSKTQMRIITEHWFHSGQGSPAQCWYKKGAAGHETNQQIGKSRGGNTTKIHAVVDGLGNPVYFQLSAGNVNDSILAIDILSHVELSGSNVLGNKAYGTIAIRKYITSKGGDIYYTAKSKYSKLMGMWFLCL